MIVRVCLLFNSIHIIHSYASLDSKEAIIALRPLYNIYGINFAFHSSVTERKQTVRIRKSSPALQYNDHYFCISQNLRPSSGSSLQVSSQVHAVQATQQYGPSVGE